MQLAVCVVLVSVAGHVAVHAHSDVTGGGPPGRVVLDGHPVGDGLQDLVLDLHHLAVGVEHLGVLHQVGGDDLQDQRVGVGVGTGGGGGGAGVRRNTSETQSRKIKI